MTPDASQLSQLSPKAKPDCAQLLADVKDSLNRSSAVNLWNRIQHNHFTRYLYFPEDENAWLITNPLAAPGVTPKGPWPRSANLKVRTTDTVICEICDLISVADSRTRPMILPSMMDIGNDEKMAKSEQWGAVLEYYTEQCDLELHRAKGQWIENAWEYGHGILFIGWREEKQLEKRTLSAEQVVQIIAMQAVQQGMDEQSAQYEGISAVYNPDAKPELVAMLKQIDPEITPKIANSIAGKLKTNEPVEYAVPVVIARQPDLRAMIPGLHVFYPPETVDIQKAPFIVTPEWVTDVDMRMRVVTEDWDNEAVEKIIKDIKPGRATFFDSVTYGSYLGQPINWALTSGMIGMGVQADAATGEKATHIWQLMRIRYRSSDPETGVPIMFETVIHPDLADFPIFHGYDMNDHARYPFADYKREERAPTLWDSRGVGEITYSEQGELTEMANFGYNNAQITLRPPYEVNSRSEMSSKQLSPGTKIVTSSSFGEGLRKIDVGGDITPAMSVCEQAAWRLDNYFKLGANPKLDPIARQTAQQARVNDYMKCAKRATRLLFQTIQQYASEEIRAGAVNGQPINLNMSKHEIQGQFSVFAEFDVMDLDPDAIMARAKMLREMIAPMDNQGLLQIAPLLRVMLMSVFPKAAPQLLANPQDAEQQQKDQAETELMRALNGLEPLYQQGGNPELKKQVTLQALQRPAIDDKGKPIVDEGTGQPLPGRVAQIAMQHPDVAALITNLLKSYEFNIDQQKNVEIGRKGVKQLQDQQ